MQRRWAQIKEGHGQVVLLSGEVGIGKSRLVRELYEVVARDGATRLTFPLLALSSAERPAPGDRTPAAAGAGAPGGAAGGAARQAGQALQVGVPVQETLPLLAALLSLPHPEGYPPCNSVPERQKQKTQEALMAWLATEAEQQPVWPCGKTCTGPIPRHWSGSGCAGQAPTVRLLTLLTCRPEFARAIRPAPR